MARMIVTLEMSTDRTVHELRDAGAWNSALNFADAEFGEVLQASAMRAKGIKEKPASAAKKGER